MKTVKEYFESLQEPYKTQSLNNSVLFHNTEFEDIYEALSCSFCWKDSIEGFKYWSDFYHEHIRNYK